MYDRFRIGLGVYLYGRRVDSCHFNPRHDTSEAILFKIQDFEKKYGKDAVICAFSYECKNGEDGYEEKAADAD